MSYVGRFFPGSGADPIETLTGNSGGPVPPSGFNINILGTGVITVVGNPATSTLTITPSGAIASSFPTDSGTATPVSGVLNILGTGGIMTAGSGNTVTIDGSGIVGGITTINGDSSFVTGSTVTFTAHPSAGSTITFDGNGTTTMTLNVTDANGNTIMGASSGNATPGTNNTVFGTNNCGSTTSADQNVTVGAFSLQSMSSAINNIAIGVSVMQSITSGSYNTVIGHAGGSSYTGTESSNILIGQDVAGVNGESNTLRLGTLTGSGAGDLNRAFIAGINGVTSSNALMVTIDSVTDQLGVLAIPVGGITTLAGNTGTATGSTVNVITSTAQGTSLITGDNVSTLTLTYTDSDFNTVLGTSAFVATHTPAVAVANTGLGASNLNSVTTGSGNTAIGFNAATTLNSGINNVILGANAMGGSTSASTNVALGISALTGLLTGSGNTAVGAGAGSNYAGAESDNILIGNLGVLAESAKIRIGTNATQTACFIAGIDGVNVGSVAKVITMATDQLGTATITAGAGITVTPGANTITIASIGSGLTWSVITANQTAAVENGYFCNKAGTLALALPATSAVGDVIEVANENTAAGVQFTQAAGQQILIGNTNTTLGATGTLTSSAVGDTLKIVCKVANTIWRVTSMVGNWTPA